MDRKSIQPDQDNYRGKVKFISNDTYEAPLFHNMCDYQHNGLMYGADGNMHDQKISTNTQYTKNSKGSITNDEFDDGFDSMYFPGFTISDTVDKQMSSDIYRRDGKTKEQDVDCNSESNISSKFRQDNGCISSNEKSRYINHGDYMPGGSMESGGFGDLDNFSKLKYGEATRNNHTTVMNDEIDRFHYTFRNYQHEHYGSNPFPEDSRRQNKSFN